MDDNTPLVASSTARRVAARMAALTLGFQARSNSVDPVVMEMARRETAQVLGDDNPLSREVDVFASQYCSLRFSASRLDESGKALVAAVMRSSWPDVSARADIEG